jgi:hypothetical protein
MLSTRTLMLGLALVLLVSAEVGPLDCAMKATQGECNSNVDWMIANCGEACMAWADEMTAAPTTAPTMTPANLHPRWRDISHPVFNECQVSCDRVPSVIQQGLLSGKTVDIINVTHHHAGRNHGPHKCWHLPLALSTTTPSQIANPGFGQGWDSRFGNQCICSCQKFHKAAIRCPLDSHCTECHFAWSGDYSLAPKNGDATCTACEDGYTVDDGQTRLLCRQQ